MSRLCAPSWPWFALAFSAAVAALVFVGVRAVNVPFWDEWEFVNLLQAVDRGQLTVGQLLQHHNEHRIVIPRLCAIALAWTTSYDTVAQCMFTVCHLTVLLAYCHAAVRRSFGHRFGTAPAWFVLVAWLLFDWRQVENLLWGFQVGLSLPLTFGFATFFHLESWLVRRRPMSLCFALAAGTCASFSSAMGLLVWPAGLAVVLLHAAADRSTLRVLVPWIGFGALVWFTYFVGYVAPPHHASVSDSFLSPVRLLSFLLTLCGAWATESSWGAVSIGVAVLIAVAWCCWRLALQKRLATQSAWVGLLVFCFLTLAMIAAGRSAQPAIAHRSAYATYSLPIVAALVVLLATLARERTPGRGRPVVAAMMVLIAIGTVCGYTIGARIAQEDRRAKRNLASVLVDYRNRSDADLSVLYPVTRLVRSGAEFLANKHWSIFANGQPNAVHVDARHYHWGDTLQFGTGGSARRHLGDGWSLDEDGFTWNLGKAAWIRLRVEPQPAPLRLEVTYAMTNTSGDRTGPQRVMVCIEGKPVGALQLAGNGHAAVDLSTEAIPGGAFELELRFPDAFSAAESGVGDRRVLAVAMSSLRLVARR